MIANLIVGMIIGIYALALITFLVYLGVFILTQLIKEMNELFS